MSREENKTKMSREEKKTKMLLYTTFYKRKENQKIDHRAKQMIFVDKSNFSRKVCYIKLGNFDYITCGKYKNVISGFSATSNDCVFFHVAVCCLSSAVTTTQCSVHWTA